MAGRRPSHPTDFGRAPHLDKIAKLLNSVCDAALEETVRLKVGIVLLREHVGSQENRIALARRSIYCSQRRTQTSFTQLPFAEFAL